MEVRNKEGKTALDVAQRKLKRRRAIKQDDDMRSVRRGPPYFQAGETFQNSAKAFLEAEAVTQMVSLASETSHEMRQI